MKILETYKHKLYAGHAIVVWVGAIWQIIHVFSYQSAQDITLLWVGALLASEIIALPLACSSKYKIWGTCHIVGAILCAVLLVGVIIYKGGV